MSIERLSRAGGLMAATTNYVRLDWTVAAALNIPLAAPDWHIQMWCDLTQSLYCDLQLAIINIAITGLAVPCSLTLAV